MIFCIIGTAYKKTLILEPEYVVYEQTTICGTIRQRKAYGEYNVDKQNVCCRHSVNYMSPGFGFDKVKVDEIAHELQTRVGARGNTGQIQKAEQTMELLLGINDRLAKLENKIDSLTFQIMNR